MRRRWVALFAIPLLLGADWFPVRLVPDPSARSAVLEDRPAACYAITATGRCGEAGPAESALSNAICRPAGRVELRWVAPQTCADASLAFAGTDLWTIYTDTLAREARPAPPLVVRLSGMPPDRLEVRPMPDGLSHARRVALSTVTAKISGSHTDFPVLFTEANLPSEMFDADGSYPAQNGGGDIRFTSDAAGNDLLPVEVVSFITDNDPANGKAEIWVKVPNVRDSQADTIYAWYNTLDSDSQPAANAANGREAVWSDYAAVWHGDDATTSTYPDASASAYTMTKNAANQPVQATGKIGRAQDFSGGNHVATNGDVLKLTSTNFTVQLWHKTPNASNFRRLMAKGVADSSGWSIRTANASNYVFFLMDGVTNGAAGTAAGSGSIGYTANTWQLAHWTFNGTTLIEYKNGSAGHSNTPSSALNTSTQTLTHGRRSDSTAAGNAYDGLLDEIRVRLGALSAGWIATEYQAHNDPAGFIDTGSPETPSGDLDIDGALSSASTMSGSIDGQPGLAGAVHVASTLAGGADLQQPLSGAIPAVSMVAGSLGNLVTVTGALASESTLYGEIGALMRMLGATAGAGTFAGSTSVDMRLAGAMPGLSGFGGALSVGSELLISGALAAQASLQGTISQIVAVSGTLNGVSGINGAVSLLQRMASALVAQSALAAELSVGAEMLLAGQLSSASEISALIGLVQSMSGALASESTVAGSVGLVQSIAGSISSASELAAALWLDMRLAGDVDAASAFAAELSGALGSEPGYLVATVQVIPALQAAIEINPALAAIVRINSRDTA